MVLRNKKVNQKPEVIELKIPAKTEYMLVVRLSVTGIGQRMEFSVDEIEDLKIAIGEACINSIRHGYEKEEFDNFIHVTFSIEPTKLEIVIKDDGRGFDITPIDEYLGKVDDAKIKGIGMGIYLMKTLMDEVKFMSDPMAADQISAFLLRKSNVTIEELFIEYYETKDDKIKDEIILRHMDFVKKLAYRFSNKGEPIGCLISVGTIGLINAVGRYDMSLGVKFTTYATHCILGEIKRYFRDKTWVLKVPRNLKELNSTVHNTIDDLTKMLSRSPTISEIAQKLDLSPETVIEVMEAGRCYKPYSLEQKVESNDGDNLCFLDSLSQENQEDLNLFDKIDLKEALGTLNKREQMIVQLFYIDGYSQTKIAERLGVSQMHVSRLLKQAIKSLKLILVERI